MNLSINQYLSIGQQLLQRMVTKEGYSKWLKGQTCPKEEQY